MRKITIIYLLAVGIVLSGCSYLKVESIGKSTIATFFEDVSGLKAAGEGLHKTMIDLYDDVVLRCAEMGGDMLNENAVNADEGMDRYFNFTLTADYNATYPRTAWATGYVVVTNANNILQYGPELLKKNPSSAAEINKIMAYALFARALAVFQICNLYAQPWSYTSDASHLGVPVVTSIPGFDEMIPRKTVAEVYEQVESDLLEALRIFNEIAGGEENSVKDCYHVSGIACEALLARFYLYKNDWAEAEKWSRKVMDKVELSPRDEYVAMYRTSQDVPGKESILRLNCYNKSSSMRAFYDPTALMKFYPDPVVYKWFDVDDVRKELLTYVAEECEADYYGKSFSAVCKYLPLKSITDEMKRVPDLFVLRVSEMYLIHAEALVKGTGANLPGAVADLTWLLARAKGCGVDDITISYSDRQSVLDLIDLERRRELGYEGHRQFDLLRTGRDLVRSSTSNAMTKTLKYPAYNYILPIAQMEMQANDKMEQNEGY
ncbi:MAG: RagB/SusD family nutrient uptake outer membrane protein [Bacteroidales bacterium]|nr:RagB/SusD family nutrient uptake outer membrane protein [Bacteroidales bacterium]